jgi:hypothetical protein
MIDSFSNMIKTGPDKQKASLTLRLTIYLVLALVTLAVFWQVNKFDFTNFDDNIYVTENNYVLSGITAGSLRWAFTTTHAQFWHPLTWLSLMLDNQLYGLNAGGYPGPAPLSPPFSHCIRCMWNRSPGLPNAKMSSALSSGC